MAFSLDGKLKLDARDFVRGTSTAAKSVDQIGDAFGKLPKEAGKAADGIEDELEDVGDSGGKIGSNFGGNLIGGFAAIGVGAAIGGMMLQGIQTAIERDQIERTMQGKFDITAKEAERFGKIAGGLYADGWGDGLEEVATLVAKSSRKLGIETDEALTDISAQVAATAQTFGEDFDAVLRSTSQLMENELAPSAEAALDLIVGAFQNGGDEAGDLLDTIDEYSQHWSAMGLSGEDALNQVVHGLQNGQRDADKMADAIKEMRLRVVENSDQVRTALENIGLDADEVVEAFIAGGPAAREAFLEVVAALKRGQTAGDDTANAVAIIGTQFEDLGPKALESLAAVDGALENTEGKAEDLAKTVASRDPAKEFKRSWSEALGWLGTQGIEEFDSASMAIADIFSPGTSDMIDYGNAIADADAAASDFDMTLLLAAASYDEARAAARDYALELGLSEDAHGGVNDAVSEFANIVATEWTAANEAMNAQASRTLDVHRQQTEEFWKSGGAAGDAADEIDDYAESTSDAEEATRDFVAALEAEVEALFGGAEAGFALREAQRKMGEEVATARGELAEGGQTLAEFQEIQDDIAQSAGAVAESLVDVATETAKASGTTVSATKKLDIWNDSMLEQAATLDGPLRDGVLDYIASVNDIPEATMTLIESAIAEGDIELAEEILENVSRARDSTIIVDAETADAEAEIERAARDRTMRITAYYRSVGSQSAPTVTPQNTTGRRAAGGPVRSGGLYEVNERGAPGELLTTGGRTYLMAASDGMVTPINQTPVGAASSGGGRQFNLTVNAGMGADGPAIGATVVEAIKQYERFGGTAWRDT